MLPVLLGHILHRRDLWPHLHIALNCIAMARRPRGQRHELVAVPIAPPRAAGAGDPRELRAGESLAVLQVRAPVKDHIACKMKDMALVLCTSTAQHATQRLDIRASRLPGPKGHGFALIRLKSCCASNEDRLESGSHTSGSMAQRSFLAMMSLASFLATVKHGIAVMSPCMS